VATRRLRAGQLWHRVLASARVAGLSVLSAAALANASVAQDALAAVPPSPSVLFQDLYPRVQNEHVFPDSKTFADATPKQAPSAILSDYRSRPPRTKAVLAAFVRKHFVVPSEGSTPLPAQLSSKRLGLQAHIAALWPVLTRAPTYPAANSSLLPLNWPYYSETGK
jgi:alpha,alpha-trehalase